MNLTATGSSLATIASTSSSSPAGASNASGALTSATGNMGKEEFLSLLVAQLQNQDPLNPMEGTEFAAQLAQYSSLEQLMQINEGISALVASQSNQEPQPVPQTVPEPQPVPEDG